MMNRNIGMVLHGDVFTDIRVQNEIEFLVSEGYSVSVLTPYLGHDESEIDALKYKVVQAKIKGKWKDYLFGTANFFPFFRWYWAREIKIFARKCKIDVLHVHDLYMGEPALTAGLDSRTKIVVDLHENFPAAILDYEWTKHPLKNLLSRPEKWKSKEAYILNNVDGVVVLSEPYANRLKAQYNKLKNENIAVYPNVPDVQKMLGFSEALPSTVVNGLCVLYFGLVSKRRGLHVASQGMKILKKQGVNCTLLIIGRLDKGERSYFETEVMNDSVIHIPWIDLTELRSYVGIADVCISPLVKNDQHESGVANKIFQYMLYEKPLLVSDCAPQKAIVETYGCGLSHTFDDPGDFAEKLLQIVNNPEKKLEMGANGNRAVLEKFNTKVMGKNIVSLYNTLLDANGGKPPKI